MPPSLRTLIAEAARVVPAAAIGYYVGQHRATATAKSNSDTHLTNPQPSVVPQAEQEPPQPNSASATAEAEAGQAAEEEKDENEEEGECGFCIYMKGGGCKDTFTDWEKCVEESEKNEEDMVEKCFEASSALKKCMVDHSDYYEPILKAEKAAEEEALQGSSSQAKPEESVEVLEVPTEQSKGSEGGVSSAH